MRKAKPTTSNAMKLLEKLTGGPLTLARALESVRKSEELSQDACAKKLGVAVRQGFVFGDEARKR